MSHIYYLVKFNTIYIEEVSAHTSFIYIHVITTLVHPCTALTGGDK